MLFGMNGEVVCRKVMMFIGVLLFLRVFRVCRIVFFDVVVFLVIFVG